MIVASGSLEAEASKLTGSPTSAWVGVALKTGHGALGALAASSTMPSAGVAGCTPISEKRLYVAWFIAPILSKP